MRGHSASKTRVNALMNRASIAFARSSLRSGMDRRVKPGDDDFDFLYSPFTSPNSLLVLFPPPTRGGRSADGARVRARHPSRHAMTGMQTPLDRASPGTKPALPSLRTTGEP